MLAADGNLYGTTANGGSGNGGTVFSVAVSGAASTADHPVLPTLSGASGGASLGTAAATLTIADVASATATPTVEITGRGLPASRSRGHPQTGHFHQGQAPPG